MMRQRKGRGGGCSSGGSGGGCSGGGSGGGGGS